MGRHYLRGGGDSIQGDVTGGEAAGIGGIDWGGWWARRGLHVVGARVLSFEWSCADGWARVERNRRAGRISGARLQGIRSVESGRGNGSWMLAIGFCSCCDCESSATAVGEWASIVRVLVCIGMVVGGYRTCGSGVWRHMCVAWRGRCCVGVYASCGGTFGAAAVGVLHRPEQTAAGSWCCHQGCPLVVTGDCKSAGRLQAVPHTGQCACLVQASSFFLGEGLWWSAVVHTCVHRSVPWGVCRGGQRTERLTGVLLACPN